MTSRGLEQMLHDVNGFNGHAHCVIWIDGVEYEILYLEREQSNEKVKVIAVKHVPKEDE